MMAGRKKSYDSSPFVAKNTRRNVGEAMYSWSSSSEEDVATGGPSCRNASKEHSGGSRTEADAPAGQDASRREENPFSFKHFLKNGSQTTYYNAGARPKLYSTPTPSPSSLEKDSTIYACNPVELPDFVQDHMVTARCYLNHEPNQQATPDIDNLPDFALNSVEQRQTRHRNESKKNNSALNDFSVDPTGSLETGLPQRNQSAPNTSSGHLNLSIFGRPSVGFAERPESSGFPLDLPIAASEGDAGSNIGARDCSETNETNVPKSLPDFLNDGPIHNRTTAPTDPGPIPNSVESLERRLLLENDRLRQELEQTRKQISEKSKRILSLESEIVFRRASELEETTQLEKAMKQVEDNLKHSTRRAANAESTVTSLKKEIKALTAEVLLLRMQNKKLTAGIAAGGGNESGSSNMDQIRTLAGDLRTAASSAEMLLRQLMSGVDNLRVLASALENVDRIEDRTKDVQLDFD